MEVDAVVALLGELSDRSAQLLRHEACAAHRMEELIPPTLA